jgi:DNA-binding NarL/FixJ family response regulator
MDVLPPLPVRVAIADDHPKVRQQLRMLLAANRTVELVGEASNGTELITLCYYTNPAIVLLDLHMPGPPPSALVLRLLHQHISLKIIIVSESEEDHLYVHIMTRLPIFGYILKREIPTSLREAIHFVEKGTVWYSPSFHSFLTTLQNGGSSTGTKTT